MINIFFIYTVQHSLNGFLLHFVDILVGRRGRPTREATINAKLTKRTEVQPKKVAVSQDVLDRASRLKRRDQLRATQTQKKSKVASEESEEGSSEEEDEVEDESEEGDDEDECEGEDEEEEGEDEENKEDGDEEDEEEDEEDEEGRGVITKMMERRRIRLLPVTEKRIRIQQQRKE